VGAIIKNEVKWREGKGREGKGNEVNCGEDVKGA
jgi:hypothetical protein